MAHPTDPACLHIHSHLTDTYFLWTESILWYIADVRHAIQSLPHAQGLSSFCKTHGGYYLIPAKKYYLAGGERGDEKSKEGRV